MEIQHCLYCGKRTPKGDNFCNDAHYRSYREERGLPWETGHLVGNKRTDQGINAQPEPNKRTDGEVSTALERINAQVKRGRPRKWLSNAQRMQAERASVSKALVPVGDRRQWLHARLHELEESYGEAQAQQFWAMCKAINAERDPLFKELWGLEKHLPADERYYFLPARFRDDWKFDVVVRR